MTFTTKQTNRGWEVWSLWCGLEHDKYGTYKTEAEATETAAALNANSRN